MRHYEIAYITDPDLDAETRRALEEKVKGRIEAAGGKVVNIDRWDRRRLAYPIKKHTEGFYYFFQAELPPQGGSAVERDLRLSEQILRCMITLLPQA
jgi:small subunit ribosomal protein S6